ncbi:PepSY-associated TM helix domain-containing protein [Methylocella tundrae]|nr:PepSY-associated TM helix domain-containing protein [Methylocella tundrae]
MVRPFLSRSIWRRIHLWLGFGLAFLMVPIGLTGVVLVFAPEVDRWVFPSRYAVTGAVAGQPAGVYLGSAAAAASGARVMVLRWPRMEGAPVTVLLRGGAFADQARLAYLDPPTGRVLDIADLRGGLIGLAHALHANLMLPPSFGRQIVGWAGAALLTMVLTGLWLWRRPSVGFLRLLRWRRGPALSSNLHHMMGFWIAAPLGAMALTGVTLGFPVATRATISLFAEVAPQAPRPASGGSMRQPLQDPQRVVDLAMQTGEGLKPVSLTPPTLQGKFWRVTAATRTGATQTVLVDDASGAVTVQAIAAGDGLLALLRRIHEGRSHGPVWSLIVVVCGFAPTLFFATGLLMWLCRRQSTTQALLSAQKGARRAASDLSSLEPRG